MQTLLFRLLSRRLCIVVRAAGYITALAPVEEITLSGCRTVTAANFPALLTCIRGNEVVDHNRIQFEKPGGFFFHNQKKKKKKKKKKRNCML